MFNSFSYIAFTDEIRKAVWILQGIRFEKGWGGWAFGQEGY